MTKRDDTDTPDSDSITTHDEIDNIREQYEKRRSANLEGIDFEKCQMVNKAGDIFRNSEANTPSGAVGEVTEQLDVLEEESKELLKIYTLIFTQLGKHSTRASIAGTMYYTGADIEKIADELEREEEKIREDICSYVGSRLRENELNEVDLDTELPDIPRSHLTETLQEMSSVAHSQFSEAIQPVQSMKLDLAAQAAQLSEIPDYSEMLLESIIPSLESLQDIAKQYEELEEIKKSDFEFKWLNEITHGVFLELYGVYKEEGNQAAAELLAEQLRDEDDIEEFKEHFSTFNEYAERKQIVDEALDAHAEGRYALSVPALLSQLDGVFIDTALDIGVYAEEDDPIGVQVVNKGEESPQHIPGIHEEYREYYASLWGKRVNILHGKETDFSNNELLSAKLIWLFFQTLHVLERLPSSEEVADYHILRKLQKGYNLTEITEGLIYEREYIEGRIESLNDSGFVEMGSEEDYVVTKDGEKYLKDLGYY